MDFAELGLKFTDEFRLQINIERTQIDDSFMLKHQKQLPSDESNYYSFHRFIKILTATPMLTLKVLNF